MTPDEIRILFDGLGVIQRNGHFRYTNGEHGSDYVNKYAIYRHVEETSRLCRSIAGHFDEDDIDIDVVVGPEKGGIVLSQWTAHHLIRMTHREILSIIAQKRPEPRLDPDDLFYFAEEDVPYIEGKNVLIVDDVANTGNSIRRVVALTRRHTGHVVGVGVLCNRGRLTYAYVGVVPEFHALIDIPMERWNPSDCPLCVSGIPISKTPGR